MGGHVTLGVGVEGLPHLGETGGIDGLLGLVAGEPEPLIRDVPLTSLVVHVPQRGLLRGGMEEREDHTVGLEPGIIRMVHVRHAIFILRVRPVLGDELAGGKVRRHAQEIRG